MNDETHLAELCKALGHPARIRIIRFLAQRQDCCCGPIVDEIGLAQSTVSQHLKILKDAGIIQGTIDGKNTCYCIADGSLDDVVRLLTNVKGLCHDQ